MFSFEQVRGDHLSGALNQIPTNKYLGFLEQCKGKYIHIFKCTIKCQESIGQRGWKACVLFCF